MIFVVRVFQCEVKWVELLSHHFSKASFSVMTKKVDLDIVQI